MLDQPTFGATERDNLKTPVAIGLGVIKYRHFRNTFHPSGHLLRNSAPAIKDVPLDHWQIARLSVRNRVLHI